MKHVNVFFLSLLCSPHYLFQCATIHEAKNRKSFLTNKDIYIPAAYLTSLSAPITKGTVCRHALK